MPRERPRWEQEPHDAAATRPELPDPELPPPGHYDIISNFGTPPDPSELTTRSFGNEQQRRLAFAHFAEEHASEMGRLLAHLPALDRELEVYADALTSWNLRYTLLEYMGGQRSAGEDEEFHTLTDALPTRRAEYDRKREQRRSMLAQANDHERAAMRWRKLAANESHEMY